MSVAKEDAIVEHDGQRLKVIAGTEIPPHLQAAYDEATSGKSKPAAKAQRAPETDKAQRSPQRSK